MALYYTKILGYTLTKIYIACILYAKNCDEYAYKNVPSAEDRPV